MAILFPIFSFSLIFLLISIRRVENSLRNWADSFILSAISWSVALVILTEGLSFFHILTFSTVMGGWLFLCVVLGFILRKDIARPISFQLLSLRKFSTIENVLLSMVSFTALVIALIAWITPPNTWDSMTYHLSRVPHWIENQSLAHYPTHILRQLSYCPFAEYVILHTVILTGNDYLANFVQYFAMIGSWIGVFAIAGLLGAGSLGRILSVFFVATIPMGILQGSSTQTDYVASFWLVCFVYCVLRWCKHFSWNNALFAGLALGLAFLTKAYTYLYALPFLLLMVIQIFRPWQVKRMGMVLVVLVMAGLLNTGYYARNWTTFGSLFGETEKVENHHFGPGVVAANLLRNMGSSLGTPWVGVNNRIENSLTFLIHGLDSSVQNYEFHVIKMSRDGDDAGSLSHFILGLLTFILCFFYRKQNSLGVYFFCLLMSAASFSLGVNWQPWINRFHLPFIILVCPVLAIIWERLNFRKSVIAIVCILFILSFPYLFSGNTKKLIGKGADLTMVRKAKYFVRKPEISSAYMRAAQGIASYQCHEIGLLLGGDSWEYPLWILLFHGNHAFRMEHVGVTNISGKLAYPLGNFSPCAVISDQSSQERWIAPFSQYKRIWFKDNISVLIKEPT